MEMSDSISHQPDGPEHLTWGALTKHEVGKLGTDIAQTRFIAEGFEISLPSGSSTPTTFTVRRASGPLHEVRVRTCRLPRGNYTFFTKRSLDLADDRLVVLVLLEDGRPARAFLIPTPAWRRPSSLLVDRDYEGLKSEPEWGIQLSGRSIPLLDEFDFAAQARSLP
jgi:hypothetical protein